MKVRNILFEEINKFSMIGNNNKSDSSAQLVQWIKEGKTKLDWCFVIEDDKQFLGKIIYGVFDDQPYDLKIWKMQIVNEHYSTHDIGYKLLCDSIKEMKLKGFKSIEYHLYSNNSDTFEEYKRIFEKQGFITEQEKKSFIANKINTIHIPTRLNYKSLQEIGEYEFISAIEKVTADTLDRDDLSSVNEYGSKQAATMYFNILKEIDFNKKWWRVAYNSSNEFVGLVVPQKFNDDMGAINYIGVCPDKRGNGYINDLLLEGSKLLFDNKIKKIIADIDIENFPLERSLNMLGYQYKRSLIVLKLKL